jgi:hypothetical protein
MAKLEVKEQLKSLLRELFQLDNTDLDFGIYVVFSLKTIAHVQYFDISGHVIKTCPFLF